MKSFVAYPLELEKCLFPESKEKQASGRLVTHYELFKRICQLKGNVVKCGVSIDDETQISLLKNILTRYVNGKIIAFEKQKASLYVSDTTHSGNILQYVVNQKDEEYYEVDECILKLGLHDKVQFNCGSVEEAIPEYLIQEPELRISYLNIDLDHYEGTMTALQFFYPRVVEGGVIILDNYYKKEEDYRAVCDYFGKGKLHLHNFSVSGGPHYFIRQ